ncbi:MAG: NAD(P)/FAD-dependent oxidoreductase [Thermomicrobiales bacterium]
MILTLDKLILSIICGLLVGIGYAIAFRRPARLSRQRPDGRGARRRALGGVQCDRHPHPGTAEAAVDRRWTATALPGARRLGPLRRVAGDSNQVLSDVMQAQLGPEPAPPAPRSARPRCASISSAAASPKVTTAEHLEQEFGADQGVAITLVSNTNALLFTPMLAEVASSSLEATHITTPLRTSLHRTEVVRGQAMRIDMERRAVILEPDDMRSIGDDRARMGRVIEYDHLVLALGAVSNYLGMDGVQKNSFDFKSLNDATRIRNRVIDLFDQAARDPDRAHRAPLLTFVVAGGGFAGAELAGGLNDFARGMLAYYPTIAPEEIRVVLVHSRDRILPELSEPLAAYALERMAARGVIFKLNARVADARPGAVILQGGEEIATALLVWTAGTTPNPLMRTLPVERDRRGAVITDVTMAVPGHPGIWALGDCAAVPDLEPGTTCPPTAQHALRQAYRLASNIHAVAHNKPPKPFKFNAIGSLCVVGHHTACAEVKGMRFSGLFAWLMWRGIYVSKLPGLDRKVRVLADWVIELFFPRDIAQT